MLNYFLYFYYLYIYIYTEFSKYIYREEDDRIIYFFLYFNFCFVNNNFDFHKKEL